MSFARLGLASILLLPLSCASLLDYDELSFKDQDAGDSSGGTGGTGGNALGGSAGVAGVGVGGGPGGAAGAGAAGSGGVSGSGGAGATGGGTSTGGASSGGSGGSLGPCASVQCGKGEYCDPADKQCKCSPGFIDKGGTCEMDLPGDPATHTAAQVCDKWKWGNTVTDSSPWTAGPNECDPGTLSQGGINDAVRRINMFRWLIGLGPVEDEPSMNETSRWCAPLASWNPPGSLSCAKYPSCCPNGCSSHKPPKAAKCYTDKGAQGTSGSNLAWGNSVSQSMTQLIDDGSSGKTDPTGLGLGHRQWLFKASLGQVGIGHYAGGGQYGRATCNAVFGGGGGGPDPTWYALPPPGPSPLPIFSYAWSFHAKSSLSKATASVKLKSNGTLRAVKFAPSTFPVIPTLVIIPDGWKPKVGEQYEVTVSGFTGGPATYVVEPVSCP